LGKCLDDCLLHRFLVISGNSARADEVSGATFNSIHVASFIQLENANRFVNSSKTRGKAVFWKKTSVPGKSIFYLVYLGKYTNMD
jgi:hypothetical protein